MTNLNISIQSQIKATVESELEFAVDFNDAWQWLEYSRKDNCKKVLVENFIKGVDYSSLLNIKEREIGATRVEEIYLTQDCLKQLAMLSGTSRGKEVRLYFIKCENELKSIKLASKEPTDILLLLEQSVAAIREARALAAIAEEKVAELAPKAEVYDAICAAGKNLRIGEVAKLISADNMGPNRLFTFLREQGVLMANNEPYSQYEFEYKYFTCTRGIKNGVTYITPRVTPKGVDFIVRLLKKKAEKDKAKLAA